MNWVRSSIFVRLIIMYDPWDNISVVTEREMNMQNDVGFLKMDISSIPLIIFYLSSFYLFFVLLLIYFHFFIWSIAIDNLTVIF